MVKKPEVLAIIPARGGSKGIPRKNIKLFAGYPLIAYSIAAGLQSELTTRVIVSTDDEEIAEVGNLKIVIPQCSKTSHSNIMFLFSDKIDEES